MNERITLPVLIFSILTGLVVQQPKAGLTQQPQQTAESKTEPASSNSSDKATASKTSAAEEKRAAEVESFIGYAQSVPAEFSADLLIQVVESGEIKDPKRKQDLLIESFYAAAKAKQPLKLVPLPGTAVDSRA